MMIVCDYVNRFVYKQVCSNLLASVNVLVLQRKHELKKTRCCPISNNFHRKILLFEPRNSRWVQFSKLFIDENLFIRT